MKEEMRDMEEDRLNYYDSLPQFVYLKNTKYAINSDYRIFIRFETEMQTTDRKKAINKALNSFYRDAHEIEHKGLLTEAVMQFIWFYKCGRTEDYQEGRTLKHTRKISQVFSYTYDAQLICGAYAALGYNLHKYMHWWKFKEIWNSLPEECEFSKIKSYRAYDGDDKDRIELREYYKLPPTEAEIKDTLRRKEIFDQLNNC